MLFKNKVKALLFIAIFALVACGEESKPAKKQHKKMIVLCKNHFENVVAPNPKSKLFIFSGVNLMEGDEYTKIVAEATADGNNRFKYACYIDNAILYDFEAKHFIDYSKVLAFEILK